LADFGLGTVTNQLVHGTIATDVVHENGSKFLVGGSQSFSSTKSRFPPHKELGGSRPIVDSRGCTINGVSGNWFIASRDIEGWIGSLASMVELGSLDSTESS
jgi:hypothetical protein